MSQGAKQQVLMEHLKELRSRIIRSLLVVIFIFISLVYFSNDIYHLIASPLLSTLPSGDSMIATSVVTPFLTPIKLTFAVSLFIAVPFLLYQLWAFIAPALYREERRKVMPLLFMSVLLFYSGVAFAYFVVFPLSLSFFAKTVPEGVKIATDISSYLDFFLTISFSFGMAFEIPVATVLLCWSGVTNTKQLREKRPYVIVGVFVIGMLLTPPDIFSQTLLAIPIWTLWELGLLVSTLYSKSEETILQQENP